jgi:hypothetical protein
MPDKIDNKVFAEMEYATADKTAVDFLGDKPRVTKKDVHNMLMVAGFTPGLGNVADAADAILYAFEGKFGEAGISAASMLPIVGQFVAAKRSAKTVRKAMKRAVPISYGKHSGQTRHIGMPKHVSVEMADKQLAKNLLNEQIRRVGRYLKETQ